MATAKNTQLSIVNILRQIEVATAHEVTAVDAARIAGRSETEIRTWCGSLRSPARPWPEGGENAQKPPYKWSRPCLRRRYTEYASKFIFALK